MQWEYLLVYTANIGEQILARSIHQMMKKQFSKSRPAPRHAK